MTRYGYTRHGYQRFRCKNCNYTYTFHNHKNKIAKEKVWFVRWITEGYSVRQLCAQCSHSPFKIKCIIQYWLDKLPVKNNDFKTFKHVIFDGTFIHGRKSIVAVMDDSKHEIFAGEYGVRENSIPELRQFFNPLIHQGLNPKSATVDGNPQVIKLFRELWPEIVIQRCLVHIQRQGLMWCRRFPKRTDAKHLRKLFLKVTYIYNFKDRDKFLSDVQTWEQRFGCSVVRAPEAGRVFSDVKRARSMLLKAIPNMFHYLNDPNIPATTNSLEGYFSRLKSKYRQHRGLSPKRRFNYFKWYFYLQKR